MVHVSSSGKIPLGLNKLISVDFQAPSHFPNTVPLSHACYGRVFDSKCYANVLNFLDKFSTFGSSWKPENFKILSLS